MHVTNTYCMLDWTVQSAENGASWGPEERAHSEADVATSHRLHLGDARDLNWIPNGSVHLVVTSPPYWTLKKYHDYPGQLGAVMDYEAFMDELAKVWTHCYRVLVPGGRIVCVVGDVCLARRRNNGRHMVVPLHADIIVRCRRIGLDYLTPILWHKIASASYEVENGSSFLGKPYEPNAIIKNDLEYLLMLRKPGGYRKPTEGTGEERSLRHWWPFREGATAGGHLGEEGETFSIKASNSIDKGLVVITVTWLRRWVSLPQSGNRLVITLHNNCAIGVKADLTYSVTNRKPS
jgi:DNA methylase